MKFFQSLLVAPAALGLLSPISVHATELNLRDLESYSINSDKSISDFSELLPSDWAYKAIRDVVISRKCDNLFPQGSVSRFEAALIINSCLKDYAQITDQERKLVDEFQSELYAINSRMDFIEASMSEFDAGSFSSTTSASFSVDFAIGAVDGATDEKTSFDYGYQIDLTTSFTGEDSLDVSIDAGTGTLSELDLNSAGNGLVVDGIAYTFPLGDKTTVFFGNSMDGSTLFNTACVYGGPTDTLDDCGNVSSALAVGLGTAAGATYSFGNGITASIGYEGEGQTSKGIATEESKDAISGQIAYSTDTYGFSVTLAEIETSETEEDTFTALNAFYDPQEEGFPSISIGYEWGDDGSAASTVDETTSYFIGLQWAELGQGTFGIAAGTHTPVIEDGDELMMYEAWYSYPINDGMTVTPIIFTKDQPAGNDDHTGVMVKTSFSF